MRTPQALAHLESFLQLAAPEHLQTFLEQGGDPKETSNVLRELRLQSALATGNIRALGPYADLAHAQDECRRNNNASHACLMRLQGAAYSSCKSCIAGKKE